MPRKKSFKSTGTPTRRVQVSPWRDPATGDVYFTCMGPMNFNKGMEAKLTPAELRELVKQAKAELARAGEVA